MMIETGLRAGLDLVTRDESRRGARSSDDNRRGGNRGAGDGAGLSPARVAAFVPGAGYPFASSSSTSTQSSISPASGGVKARSPVFGNTPIALAEPVRGLNHQAFTDAPVMTLILTRNVRATGAYTIA